MKEFIFEKIEKKIQRILFNSLGDIERRIIDCLYFQKLSEEKARQAIQDRYEEIMPVKEFRKRKNSALKQMEDLYLFSERQEQARESLDNFLDEFERMENLEDIKEEVEEDELFFRKE